MLGLIKKTSVCYIRMRGNLFGLNQGIKNSFPDKKFFGSELFVKGLVYAKKRMPDVTFVTLDAVNLDAKEQYDIIGAFDVLEHIEKDEIVLKNIFSALNVGGGVILTVPQHEFLWSKADTEACHVRRNSKKELVKKVQTEGFQIKYVSSFVSLLLPCMYIARKFTKDAKSGVDMNSILNKVFEVVMLVERKLLQIGIKFPFGGSLILVANKCSGDSI